MMTILKQISPRTSHPYGFQHDACGKKFTALHKTEQDAALAFAIHVRSCKEKEPESPQGRLA